MSQLRISYLSEQVTISDCCVFLYKCKKFCDPVSNARGQTDARPDGERREKKSHSDTKKTEGHLSDAMRH